MGFRLARDENFPCSGLKFPLFRVVEEGYDALERPLLPPSPAAQGRTPRYLEPAQTRTMRCFMSAVPVMWIVWAGVALILLGLPVYLYWEKHNRKNPRNPTQVPDGEPVPESE